LDLRGLLLRRREGRGSREEREKEEKAEEGR